MSKSESKGGLRARAARMWDQVLGTPPLTTASSRAPSPACISSAPISSAPAHPFPNALGEPSLALEPASSTPSTRMLSPAGFGMSTLPPSAPLVPPESQLVEGGAVAWIGFRAALRGLHKSCVLFPPLQLAIGSLISCIEAYQQSENSEKDHKELALELTNLSESLDRHLKASNSAPMSEFVVRTAQSIQKQVELIKKQQSHNEGKHVMKTALNEEEEVMRCYRQIQVLFQRLQADANLSMWSIANEQLANNRLKDLKPVRLATYDSSLSTEINRRMCTENTRTSVLSNLDSWSDDPNSPNVYWMNGMAGTGKTTIACTFANALKKRKQLAASFFCTRTVADCQNVARIVPTIAYQLARYSTPFQSALCRVLGNDPDLGSSAVSTQFERLIKEPLLEVKEAIPEGLVMVIDALDECTASKGVELVLDMLFRAAADLPLKFFVTSRPEPNILKRIHDQPDTSRSIFVLHDIEQSLVQADIELYFQEELPFVTSDQARQLAKLAGRLFIYAATVARYVKIGETSGDLERRLQAVLSIVAKSTNKHAEIDQLYTSILSAAIDNNKLEKDEKDDMQLVLWTVICALEPISVEALAALTGIIHQQRTRAMLQPLQSVLYVSKSHVTILHASLPDFIFDESRSSAFFCDIERHSKRITERCFHLMKEQLHFNICGLESSYLRDGNLPNMQERVGTLVSPALAYVCRHWGDHLEQAAPSNQLFDLMQEFLSERLLFWMEVMNLKHWMGMGVRLILAAKQWLMACSAPPELLNLVEDARKFVTAFAASAVSQSTPHLYVSALPFCQRSSNIFKQYSKRICSLVKLKGGGIERRGGAMLASWRVASGVSSIAYSPDGAHLVIGCGDGSILLKDAYDGTSVGAPCQGHTHYVASVAFSPDGLRFVSGSNDCTIRVWNIPDGTLVGSPFEGHTNWVTSVAFSPDGSNIVSGSSDCTVRLWRVQDGKLIGLPLRGHSFSVVSVAFSPDGSRVISGSDDSTIRMWNAQSGTLVVAPLEGHSEAVTSLAFSPNGSRIVSGSDDKTIRLWDAQDGTLIGTPLMGHTSWITSVSFSPDGSRIVSGSHDRTIRLWNTDDGTLVGIPLKGHTDVVTSVTFLPDGSHIVSGSDDKTIRMWNAQDRTPAPLAIEGHTGPIRSVAFSPDGSYIISGSDDCTICIWNVHEGTLAVGPVEGHAYSVTSVAFSPDGTRAVSGSYGRTISMWDIQTGTLMGTSIQGHTSSVTSVAFSPDGSHIVSGSHDRTVCVWNAHDGTLVGTPFEGHTDHVTSVAFSPDGLCVVSGSLDLTIRLWSVKDGTPVRAPLIGHTGFVTSVAFSPDGAHVVSGSEDHTLRLWGLQDGTPFGTPFEGHFDAVNSVAFSPDGEHIVSGSDDCTVRVWNVRDSSPVSTPLEGHTSRVTSVNFSPDGSRIVSSSIDQTIRISNLRTTSTTDTCIASEDGWLMSNSQLLLWIPPDLTQYLSLPHNTWVAGPEGVVYIDYSNISSGNGWSDCYSPQ